jgi:hypothetical protein
MQISLKPSDAVGTLGAMEDIAAYLRRERWRWRPAMTYWRTHR